MRWWIVPAALLGTAACSATDDSTFEARGPTRTPPPENVVDAGGEGHTEGPKPQPPPDADVCHLDGDAFPACPDGVSSSAACDRTVSACSAATGAFERYLCRQYPSVGSFWTPLFSVTAACSSRIATPCGGAPGPSGQQFVDTEVDQVLWGCLGSERNLAVSFKDGCATWFTADTEEPDRIACLDQRLGEKRYTCGDSVHCAVEDSQLVSHY